MNFLVTALPIPTPPLPIHFVFGIVRLPSCCLSKHCSSKTTFCYAHNQKQSNQTRMNKRQVKPKREKKPTKTSRQTKQKSDQHVGYQTARERVLIQSSKRKLLYKPYTTFSVTFWVSDSRPACLPSAALPAR